MTQQSVLVVNLFLGLITVGVALLVIQVWMPTYLRRPHSQRGFGPHEWLLVGITIGFASTIGDNVFWGITWYSKMRNWPTSPWWFDHGPAANMIFRHVGKISAALCHLEAARQASVISTEDLAARSTMVVLGSIVAFAILML